MDRERLIGSAVTGLMVSSALFTGATLYDCLFRFPEWKSQHGGESIVFYQRPTGETVAQQMEPSWSLYFYAAGLGAVLGAAGFMIAHPRQRAPLSTNLTTRVNPLTQ